MKRASWGIIRFAPGTGSIPEGDAAAFGGWYADREDAKAQYNDWCKRFPNWIIAIVQQDEDWVRFR
jgi:hypothetical protein